MKKLQRLMAALLTLAMLLSVFPLQAFAEEATLPPAASSTTSQAPVEESPQPEPSSSAVPASSEAPALPTLSPEELTPEASAEPTESPLPDTLSAQDESAFDNAGDSLSTLSLEDAPDTILNGEAQKVSGEEAAALGFDGIGSDEFLYVTDSLTPPSAGDYSIAPFSLQSAADYQTYSTDYFGDQLTAQQRQLYDRVDAAQGSKDKMQTGNTYNWYFDYPLDGATMTQDLADSLYASAFHALYAWKYDHPLETSWTNSFVSGSLSYDSTTARVSGGYGNGFYDSKTASLQDAAITTVTSEAQTKSTRHDQLEALADYFCIHGEYDRASLYVANTTEKFYRAHSSVGILAYNLGVCESYAKSVKIICDKLSIPCVLVTSETHMWNYVQMENGLWYMLDATWMDDGSTLNTINNDYFLVSNRNATDAHVEETEFSFPATWDVSYAESPLATIVVNEDTSHSYAAYTADELQSTIDGLLEGTILFQDGSTTGKNLYTNDTPDTISVTLSWQGDAGELHFTPSRADSRDTVALSSESGVDLSMLEADCSITTSGISPAEIRLGSEMGTTPYQATLNAVAPSTVTINPYIEATLTAPSQEGAAGSSDASMIESIRLGASASLTISDTHISNIEPSGGANLTANNCTIDGIACNSSGNSSASGEGPLLTFSIDLNGGSLDALWSDVQKIEVQLSASKATLGHMEACALSATDCVWNISDENTVPSLTLIGGQINLLNADACLRTEFLILDKHFEALNSIGVSPEICYPSVSKNAAAGLCAAGATSRNGAVLGVSFAEGSTVIGGAALAESESPEAAQTLYGLLQLSESDADNWLLTLSDRRIVVRETSAAALAAVSTDGAFAADSKILYVNSMNELPEAIRTLEPDAAAEAALYDDTPVIYVRLTRQDSSILTLPTDNGKTGEEKVTFSPYEVYFFANAGVNAALAYIDAKGNDVTLDGINAGLAYLTAVPVVSYPPIDGTESRATIANARKVQIYADARVSGTVSACNAVIAGFAETLELNVSSDASISAKAKVFGDVTCYLANGGSETTTLTIQEGGRVNRVTTKDEEDVASTVEVKGTGSVGQVDCAKTLTFDRCTSLNQIQLPDDEKEDADATRPALNAQTITLKNSTLRLGYRGGTAYTAPAWICSENEMTLVGANTICVDLAASNVALIQCPRVAAENDDGRTPVGTLTLSEDSSYTKGSTIFLCPTDSSSDPSDPGFKETYYYTQHNFIVPTGSFMGSALVVATDEEKTNGIKNRYAFCLYRNADRPAAPRAYFVDDDSVVYDGSWTDQTLTLQMDGFFGNDTLEYAWDLDTWNSSTPGSPWESIPLKDAQGKDLSYDVIHNSLPTTAKYRENGRVHTLSIRYVNADGALVSDTTTLTVKCLDYAAVHLYYDIQPHGQYAAPYLCEALETTKAGKLDTALADKSPVTLSGTTVYLTFGNEGSQQGDPYTPLNGQLRYRLYDENTKKSTSALCTGGIALTPGHTYQLYIDSDTGETYGWRMTAGASAGITSFYLADYDYTQEQIGKKAGTSKTLYLPADGSSASVLAACATTKAGPLADNAVIAVSSNPDVVTVDVYTSPSNLISVLPKGAGTATVTVTSVYDSTKKATIQYTVKQAATSLSLSSPTTDKDGYAVLIAGKTFTPKLTAIGGVGYPTYTYTLENDDFVSFVNAKDGSLTSTKGTVKALQPGEVYLTVTGSGLPNVSNATGSLHIRVYGAAASGVTVSPATLTVDAASSTSYTISADVSNATDRLYLEDGACGHVNFTASASNSIVVKDNGNNTATITLLDNAKGSCTITATAADGSGKKATCKVSAGHRVQDISIACPLPQAEDDTYTLGVGKSARLTASVFPADASAKALVWTSSVPGILTVDKNGNVKGVAAGIAWVTAASTDGSGVSSRVAIKVYNTAKTLTLSNSSADSKGVITTSIWGDPAQGHSAGIRIDAVAKDASEHTAGVLQDFTWSVSGALAAYVINYGDGNFAVSRPGTFTVTATTRDGSNLRKSYTVKVLQQVYSIQPIAPKGVQIDAAGNWLVKAGTKIDAASAILNEGSKTNKATLSQCWIDVGSAGENVDLRWNSAHTNLTLGTGSAEGETFTFCLVATDALETRSDPITCIVTPKTGAALESAEILVPASLGGIASDDALEVSYTAKSVKFAPQMNAGHTSASNVTYAWTLLDANGNPLTADEAKNASINAKSGTLALNAAALGKTYIVQLTATQTGNNTPQSATQKITIIAPVALTITNATEIKTQYLTAGSDSFSLAFTAGNVKGGNGPVCSSFTVTSSKPSVAAVNRFARNDGSTTDYTAALQKLASGSATITVLALDGTGTKKTASVTVKAAATPTTSFTASTTKPVLLCWENAYTVAYALAAKNGAAPEIPNVSWSVSDASMLLITNHAVVEEGSDPAATLETTTANGLLYLIPQNQKTGTVTVTGRTLDGSNKTLKLTVTLTRDGSKLPSSIQLSAPVGANNNEGGSLYLCAGSSMTISATAMPLTTSDKTLVYSMVALDNAYAEQTGTALTGLTLTAQNGKFTLKAARGAATYEGRVRITASLPCNLADSNPIISTIDVHVVQPTTSILFGESYYTDDLTGISKVVQAGSSYSFYARAITATNATGDSNTAYDSQYCNLRWSVSGAATVTQSGFVTINTNAKSGSRITITAAALDGSKKKATLTLTVAAADKLVNHIDTSFTAPKGVTFVRSDSDGSYALNLSAMKTKTVTLSLKATTLPAKPQVGGVIWSFDPDAGTPPTGVTINATTGKLVIPTNCTETISVIARAKDGSGIMNVLTFKPGVSLS